VHGHQPKAEWNGHYRARIYHPLITSIAETGDMLDARLRPGNVGTAEGALDVILDVVDRAEASLCKITTVRIDAGFPSGSLLSGLDERGVHHVARLRAKPLLGDSTWRSRDVLVPYGFLPLRHNHILSLCFVTEKHATGMIAPTIASTRAHFCETD
jgi:hypothetical protein